MVFSVVHSRNATNCGHEGRCPEGTSCVRPGLFYEPHFCLANDYRLGSFQIPPRELYCPKLDVQFSTAVWVSLLWLALFVGFIIGQFLRLRAAGSSRSRSSSRDSTPIRSYQHRRTSKFKHAPTNDYADY
uniref:EGF-like domain-containing protein n=1 Tax=Panagrellus redivivus TaxID=6233 RepID=A0A7E4V196_PANRE